ncbi:hypothetical protein L611_002400000460 [Aminobacter sp. J15]|nr:hypothetical protein L611_002400000460 [Aminobacter sp. J15]
MLLISRYLVPAGDTRGVLGIPGGEEEAFARRGLAETLSFRGHW